MYSHDAERHALAHFTDIAHDVDPAFSVQGDWIAQAVQNAEIDRSSLDGRAKRERVRGSPRPIE